MQNTPLPPFLAGRSAMAGLMRGKDWSATDVGPVEGWPQSLRSVVHLMLGSGFPMFVAWGPKLEMLYNDSYAEILGKKHPASLGSPFQQVWYDILDDIMPLVERALRGETFYMENLPLRMQRRGYEEDTWFTFSYSPVLDESGRTAGFYCACAETTATVLAERHQRAEQERLQALFQQAPGFVAVVRGPEHRFDVMNPAYARLTGNRDLLGRTLREALPEAAAQGFVELLDGVYRSGEPYVGRAMRFLLDPDGDEPAREAFVDFVYQPLTNASGAIDGIFVYGYEVTEQQRAQQEARRAAEALEAADRQKDEFLATLAHELRNPLAPIRTAVHLLSSPTATEGVRSRAVQIVGRQVSHMARLLDDLIDIARITQRRLVLKPEWVTLQAVVDTALEAATPAAEAKRHALAATIEQPLQRLHADPVRLAQVLSNLLNNAAKYTDPGGRITLDVRSEGAWVTFAVTDTGIGMSPEGLQNVFAMFAQEQSALDRSEGGLGIGLALAKGLVELHGGTIAAASAGVGRGSRFEVRLPLAAQAEPVQPAEPEEVGAPTGDRLVLLADDNVDAVEVLAELLRLEGHQVHVANNGELAATLAAQLRPQVLVLDIGMPGLNGYEVARHVRSQDWGRHALLIAATGWGQEEDRRKALAAGFDLHLTKPFAPDQLLAAIASRVGGG